MEEDLTKDWINSSYSSDEQLIADISRATVSELLDLVLQMPEYMTDPYYADFRRAICARHVQLKERRFGKS